VRERENSAFDNLLAGSRESSGAIARETWGEVQCLRSIGVEALAFADNSRSKWGSQVDGVPVSPKMRPRIWSSALFLIALVAGHYYRDSRTQARSMGWAYVAHRILRWKFADQLLPDFCQDLPTSCTSKRRCA